MLSNRMKAVVILAIVTVIALSVYADFLIIRQQSLNELLKVDRLINPVGDIETGTQ